MPLLRRMQKCLQRVSVRTRRRRVFVYYGGVGFLRILAQITARAKTAYDNASIISYEEESGTLSKAHNTTLPTMKIGTKGSLTQTRSRLGI